ncbi:MAG: XRE family transcriptional regulator, partial [Myxococcales bacterium]
MPAGAGSSRSTRIWEKPGESQSFQSRRDPSLKWGPRRVRRAAMSGLTNTTFARPVNGANDRPCGRPVIPRTIQGMTEKPKESGEEKILDSTRRLVEAIRQSNWTGQGLERAAGISPGYMSRVIRLLRNPKPDMLGRLTDVLGIPLSWVEDGTGPAPTTFNPPPNKKKGRTGADNTPTVDDEEAPPRAELPTKNPASGRPQKSKVERPDIEPDTAWFYEPLKALIKPPYTERHEKAVTRLLMVDSALVEEEGPDTLLKGALQIAYELDETGLTMTPANLLRRLLVKNASKPQPVAAAKETISRYGA